jgi:hypothetical protein
VSDVYGFRVDIRARFGQSPSSKVEQVSRMRKGVPLQSGGDIFWRGIQGSATLTAIRDSLPRVGLAVVPA